MRVLITGASGFIGKEVVSELKRRKHSVIEFDWKHGKSVLNKKQLLDETRNVDAVIHLAAVVENSSNSLWETNVEGTKNVAEASQKNGVKKIVFLSSTGVYGFTTKKVSEKTPINPGNEYEKSKAEGEKIVQSIHLNTNIIRSAMVFGANNYWKKMFELLGKKYPLPCEGNNTFQVIYVKELARAINLVLQKGKAGEVYLAAGREKPTLNEFCEMVQEELGIEKGVKHMPASLGVLVGSALGVSELSFENIRHLSKEKNYDTRKIQKLGWKQKITLKKAIKEVVKEFLNKKQEKG